jgi:hypothetical protein
VGGTALLGMDERHSYYYYAGRDRIELEPEEEWVAVDATCLGRGKRDTALRKRLERERPVTGDVYVVGRKELSDADVGRLDRKGAVQPVFKHGRARIIVLPEVRASLREEKDTRALKRLIKKPEYKAEIVRQSGRRVVLRPASGRGLDALTIANRLKEEGEATVAQARFIRMVPRPDVSRKRNR